MTPEEKKKEDERIAKETADAEALEKSQLEKESLEIELGEDGQPKTDEQKKKDDEDARAASAEQHKRNSEAAQRRIDQDKQRLKKEIEDKNRRIAELEKRSVGGQFPGYNNQAAVKDKAYWEKRLADDPVTALDEYEEHKYQQRLRQQQEASERQGLVDSFYKSLEESKGLAIEEFPELADESSEHFSMFMDILDKHPEWRNSPIGPIKVANEMKKVLAKGDSGSNILSRAKSEGANAEKERQARISNQPLSSNRDTGAKKTFTLTKDQLEWCKENNMKPENYAKIAMRTAQGEGVTV